MTPTAAPGAALRSLLAQGQVALPGVFNAITALQAQACGFGALYLSGAGVTNALTGYPDIALLTLTEMAQQARYVARAVSVPVVADADTGYGEALNVARAVEEFEHAGLAGIHLEDQVAPKRCGHLDGKQVIPAEEMAAKVRSAVRARRDPSFFLIARTDARSVNGLTDAIERAKRYRDAGADAIFPESLRSRDEFAAFAAALPDTILLANMTEFGKTPYLTAAEFTALGYRMVLFPMTAFRVMMHAAREVYAALHTTGTQTAFLDRMQTRAELYDLICYADYDAFDRAVALTPVLSPGAAREGTGVRARIKESTMSATQTQAPAGYKPGLEGVVAGISAISEVDAERNELIYRGYDIHGLVEHCSFDEVAYLLLHGDLPTQTQFDDFIRRVREQREVPGAVYDMFRAMPASAHPMDRLKAAVALLATLDPEVEDNSAEANLHKAERLYAKMPTLVVNGYRIAEGQPPAAPAPALCHNANFFQMLTGEVHTDLFGRVLNVTQILYAEHGYNASTFAARVTVSTLADLHSGVVSAIGTLKGPLHGGANEAAMAMLLEIGTPDRAAAWVREALAQKKKIMGFGHREYKHGDERAKIVKRFANELAERTGEMKWRDISQIVEDEMRAAKGLYPNLDFPVASAYYLMGLPIPLYTPIFVMSRVTGWCAHIMEQLANNRLIRPQHLYDGPRDRKVVPLAERG